MDMSNATNAGPSHGLLDLLFGTVPEEEGKKIAKNKSDFDPILALMNALDKKSAEVTKENSDETGVVGATAHEASGQNPIPPHEVFSDNRPNTVEGLAQMNLKPEVLSALKAQDKAEILKLIESRKAELKRQMPSLGELEKVIQKEGLEKVLSTGSVAQIMHKLENKQVRPEMSAAEFLSLSQSQQTQFKVNNSRDKAGPLPVAVPNNATLAAPVNNSPIAAEAVQSTSSVTTSASPIGMNISQFGGNSSNFGSQPDGSSGGAMDESAIFGTTAAAVANAGPDDVLILENRSESALQMEVVPKVVQNIGYIARKGGGEMKMTIRPQELGEIRLEVATVNNQVKVRMIVDSPQIAAAINNGSHALTEALSQQGLSLNNIEVIVRETLAGAQTGNSGSQTQKEESESSGEEQFSDRKNDQDSDFREQSADYDGNNEGKLDSGELVAENSDISGPNNSNVGPLEDRLLDVKA